MKSAETKSEFIRLRAEGLSYQKIHDRLGIAKDTCRNWEQEYKDHIAELKADQLKSLYKEYGMTREARITKLGNTLNRLETTLSNVDLSELPPEKLLDFYLKYTDALKAEYIAPAQPIVFDNREPKEITNAITDLLNRIRAGEVTGEQASRESVAITNLLKAFETTKLKEKLDALESIIEGR